MGNAGGSWFIGRIDELWRGEVGGMGDWVLEMGDWILGIGEFWA
jgi:hypothetical protein